MKLRKYHIVGIALYDGPGDTSRLVGEWFVEAAGKAAALEAAAREIEGFIEWHTVEVRWAGVYAPGIR